MKFLIRFGVSLGVWFFIYTTFIKPSYYYDAVVIDNLTGLSSLLLEFTGIETILLEGKTSGLHNLIRIPGSEGVIVGPECDGLTIIMLFVLFVLAFSGEWKHKLWYVTLGAALLFVLNAIRIALLAYIVKYYPDWLAFNHDYTFTIIIYGSVFLMWMLWVNKFSK